MKHRHLNHESYTLAAIDDIIDRGMPGDWDTLRDAAQGNSALLEDIQRVCAPRLNNPFAQRYHLWSQYARSKSA